MYTNQTCLGIINGRMLNKDVYPINAEEKKLLPQNIRFQSNTI